MFSRCIDLSFQQFDKDGNGKLEFDEVQTLMQKLIENLQLPPLDSKTSHWSELVWLPPYFQNECCIKYSSVMMSIRVTLFSSRSSKQWSVICVISDENLSVICVICQYWELLLLIKEKFYPTRKVKVRRSSFVGQRNLSGEQNMESAKFFRCWVRIDRSILSELFTFVKRLGAGSFGEVFLVREKAWVRAGKEWWYWLFGRSGFERVCKIINKDLSKIPMEQIEVCPNFYIYVPIFIFMSQFLYFLLFFCKGRDRRFKEVGSSQYHQSFRSIFGLQFNLYYHGVGRVPKVDPNLRPQSSLIIYLSEFAMGGSWRIEFPKHLTGVSFWVKFMWRTSCDSYWRPLIIFTAYELHTSEDHL